MKGKYYYPQTLHSKYVVVKKLKLYPMMLQIKLSDLGKIIVYKSHVEVSLLVRAGAGL